MVGAKIALTASPVRLERISRSTDPDAPPPLVPWPGVSLLLENDWGFMTTRKNEYAAPLDHRQPTPPMALTDRLLCAA
jgi:hypothetical protein